MTTTDPTREQVRDDLARALNPQAWDMFDRLVAEQHPEGLHDHVVSDSRERADALVPVVVAEVAAAEQRGAAKARTFTEQDVETVAQTFAASGDDWNLLHEREQDSYRKDARAALAAIGTVPDAR